MDFTYLIIFYMYFCKIIILKASCILRQFYTRSNINKNKMSRIHIWLKFSKYFFKVNNDIYLSDVDLTFLFKYNKEINSLTGKLHFKQQRLLLRNLRIYRKNRKLQLVSWVARKTTTIAREKGPIVRFPLG